MTSTNDQPTPDPDGGGVAIPPTPEDIAAEPHPERKKVLAAMTRIVMREPRNITPGKFGITHLAQEAEVDRKAFYRNPALKPLGEDWKNYIESNDTTTEKEREQAAEIEKLKAELKDRERISHQHYEAMRRWKQTAEATLLNVTFLQDQQQTLEAEIARYRAREEAAEGGQSGLGAGSSGIVPMS